MNSAIRTSSAPARACRSGVSPAGRVRGIGFEGPVAVNVTGQRFSDGMSRAREANP